MALAGRLSPKFHSWSCPRSFASPSTVHFLDNLSATDIISSNIPVCFLVDRAFSLSVIIYTTSAYYFILDILSYFNESLFGT